MKANFALSLSFEGIRLLHRAAGGWRHVDEVSLSDPDLGGALAALRRTALALEPSGLRTKLIIPGSQIKYLTIDTAGLSQDELFDAAMKALDGATPYDVGELAFDLSPDGDQTHIAAVAIETLAEAEAFAVEHRFTPISVVAVPEGEDFLGEPFFGATKHARSLLEKGEKVEPDGIAVVVLDRVPAGSGPVVEVEDDAAVADGEDIIPARDDVPEVPEADEDVSEGIEDEATPAPPSEDVDDDEKVEATPAGPAPGFASRRGADIPAAAPQLGGVTRRFTPSPLIDEDDDDVAAAPDEDPPRIESDVLAPALQVPEDPDDELDDEDTEAAPDRNKPSRGKLKRIGGLMSRRSRKSSKEPPPVHKVSAEDLAPAARQAEPAPAERASQPHSERQRMTVFGARQPEADEVATANKPRYLGLILTAILLVFLAAVAAWSMVFSEDNGLSRLFPTRAEPETAAPDIADTVITDESAPDEDVAAVVPVPAPDLSDLPAPVETASLSEPLVPEDTDQPPLAEPTEPAPFDPAEAEAEYAVTGIWTIPPTVSGAPALLGLDDLYMTSIDPANFSFDAVALLPGRSYRTDDAPLAPGVPAPAGTEIEIDPATGRVVPTPDGALSPDGFAVFLGKPPAIPPAAPNRDPEEVLPDPDAVDDLPPDSDLAAFRPRLRPGDLVENTERSQLGGLSRSELAEIRPRLRPRTEKQVEEDANDAPTALAIATSPRPASPPRNFARIVEQSRSARAADEPEETQEVAAVAPRTVRPSIPSSTSVTREATVKNAINLRKINLMGVYGTPANRRALVRLSNGRYKKVKVGDRIDGGRVSAIGDAELRYRKGSRNIVLKMPKT